MLDCLFIPSVFFSSLYVLCACRGLWWKAPRDPELAIMHALSRLDHPELLLLQLASLPVACAP